MGYKDYLETYEFSTNLPSDSNKKVVYKPISAKQLKMLVPYAEENSNYDELESILDDFIAKSIISNDFNIDNILPEDKMFLLFELRKKSKGDRLEYSHKCLSCNSQSLQIVDLNNIKINYLPTSYNKEVEINKNLKLIMRFNTRGDYKLANEIISNIPSIKNSKFENVEKSTILLALAIEKIITPKGEEILSLEDKIDLLNHDSITPTIYEKIVQWNNNIKLGIDFNYTIKCPFCGSEEVVELPKENFFF